MKRTRRLLFLLFLTAPVAFSQQDIVERASLLELEGKFRDAAALLRSAMDNASVALAERKKLEFELDRLERIKLDYTLTKENLYAILQKSVKGLTEQEFERWVTEGRFDGRTIDGTTYYIGVSRSNLFFRYHELASRRINPRDDSEFEQNTWQSVKAIKKAAQEQKTPYILPKRFATTMTVTAEPNAAPAGEIIRAWLPIPRAYPYQKDFELLASSSPAKSLASDDSPIRTAYLEQAAELDKPTVFRVDYAYTTYGIWFDLKTELVQQYDRNDAAVNEFLKEGTHVRFTEKINELSTKLAGNEANMLLKARKFYNWITENIKYSYALEYSTIRNISEYCMTKGYGDCGQAALLFITLCRANGIPARWQSGWLTMPGGKTIHDWTEIYIKPYGWVPVDPYMGVFAMRYFSGPVEMRKEIRDFYFGGLDQYRMAANGDHNQILVPAKQSLRSDNVDFQRGELEFGTTNIYFNKYSYKLEIKEQGKTP